MKVRWTRSALSPRAAANLLVRIESRVETLAAHPELGCPGRVVQTRELVIACSPFLVAYRLKSNTIDILAILHSSRRWPETFQ